MPAHSLKGLCVRDSTSKHRPPQNTATTTRFQSNRFPGNVILYAEKHTPNTERHTREQTRGGTRSPYLEVSQAAPGVFRGAASRGLVRLAGYPECLVCVNAISAFLLALFESCRFSLLVSDSIHPKKQQHSILVICKQTTDLVL